MQVPPIEERRRLFKLAEENAKKVLKPGDRIRVTKCPGTKRWITFAGWDGHWMVSKSGINDYSPGAVDMVNGEAVDFKATPVLPQSLLLAERDCCGTFAGSPHRKTCERHKRHNAKLNGGP